MSTSQASSLRSRKIDLKRAMPVFRFDQLSDLDDSLNISRVMGTISTGVEKGEEEEHHLQAALVSRHNVVIPTPDASVLVDLPNYDAYYTKGYTLSKSLIRFSSLVEEVIGCLYNANERDLAWLKKVNEDIMEPSKAKLAKSVSPKAKDIVEAELRREITADEFELHIYHFDQRGNEKVSGECPLFTDSTLEKSNLNLKEQEKIFEYWRDTRYNHNNGARLRPVLKSEDMSLNPDHDPYVCFRQRESKTFRKVRRSDTLALDKLKKVVDDLSRVKGLVALAHQRELVRQDLINLEETIFEKRVQLRRRKKMLNLNTPDTLEASPEKVQKRRRDDDSTKIRIPLHNLRDAVSLVNNLEYDDVMTSDRIEEMIKRERGLREKSGWIDCTEFPYSAPSNGYSHHFDSSTLTRRRVGRGGRVIFDRMKDPNLAVKLVQSVEDIMYRAFKVNYPQEGYSKLNNQPSHIVIFDPTKSPVIDRQRPIIDLPMSPVPPPGRRRKASEKEKVVLTRKRTPEEIKQANVKEFLKQAQMQAQAQLLKQSLLGQGQSGSPLTFAAGSNYNGRGGLGIGFQQQIGIQQQQIQQQQLLQQQQLQIPQQQQQQQRQFYPSTSNGRMISIPSRPTISNEGIITMKQDIVAIEELLVNENI